MGSCSVRAWCGYEEKVSTWSLSQGCVGWALETLVVSYMQLTVDTDTRVWKGSKNRKDMAKRGRRG